MSGDKPTMVVLATPSSVDDVLRGTLEVVEGDRLTRGHYVYGAPTAGQLCNGAEFCLIGAMWAAAGVPVPNGHQGHQDDFWEAIDARRGSELFDRRPLLRAAFDAAEQAALEAILAEQEEDREKFLGRYDQIPSRSWAEHYLEGVGATDANMGAMLRRSRGIAAGYGAPVDPAVRAAALGEKGAA